VAPDVRQPGDDGRQLAQFSRHLPARLPRRRGYRMRSAKRGGGFDLQRSLRDAIRTDGELILLRRRERQLRPRAILLLIAVRLVSERDDVPIDFGPVLALYGLTGLIAAAGTLRFAVTTPKVDSETIHAALSTYLLAGVFFGVLYSPIEFSWPGSFSGPDDFTESAATYYSFVTLATLGYGDVLPRTDIARGAAVFEVIGGQLFLAVMVARLIGAFEATNRRA